MGRFHRRNRNQAAAPVAGARIVIAAFRPAEGFEKFPADPAAAGLITLALPNANAAELLDAALHQQRFNELGDAAKARIARFAKALAANPDSRLRSKAAGYLGLDAESVKTLARDPAFDVRDALTLNHHALLALAPEAVVELCGVEPIFLDQALGELARVCDEDSVEACRERIEAVRAAADANPDPAVRREIRNLMQRYLERFKRAAGEKQRPRFVDFRSRHEEDAVFAEPVGEYVWAAVLADPEAEGPLLSDDALVMPLSRTVLERASWWLPEGDASAEVLDRLALEASHEVREDIATRSDLPAAAAKRLALDPVHEIRVSVLTNDEAAAKLTNEELLQAIDNDPALIEEICDRRPEERVARLIAAKFAGHADPRVADAIAGLDLGEEDAEA